MTDKQAYFLGKIKETLAAINEVVGRELTLYRCIDDAWVTIILDGSYEFSSNIQPAHASAYSGPGIPRRGRFALAPTQEAGNRSLQYPVTSFTISPFPGCCAFAISTGANVPMQYRNRGINKLGNQLRQYLAGFTGYTALVCTDIESSIHSIRTLKSNGFTKLYSTRNRRTSNIVNLYIKEIN